MSDLGVSSYVVNFGPSRTGLGTVGYRRRGVNRSTQGVSEIRAGTGIYAVSLVPPTTPSYLLWDTGDGSPHYWVQELNTPLSEKVFKAVNFGTSRSGLATVGVVVNGVRTPLVELLPNTGIYGAEVTPPRGFVGPITWDSGEASGSILYGAGCLNQGYLLLSCYPTSSYALKKVTPSVVAIELRS